MRNLMMGLQKSPINQMDSSVMPMANGTTGGVFTTETSLFPLDTEMSDQGNEGYALPSFQWSKRLYGSLIAKFTLYFSRVRAYIYDDDGSWFKNKLILLMFLFSFSG
jgi:hypothetical protein